MQIRECAGKTAQKGDVGGFVRSALVSRFNAGCGPAPQVFRFRSHFFGPPDGPGKRLNLSLLPILQIRINDPSHDKTSFACFWTQYRKNRAAFPDAGRRARSITQRSGGAPSFPRMGLLSLSPSPVAGAPRYPVAPDFSRSCSRAGCLSRTRSGRSHFHGR